MDFSHTSQPLDITIVGAGIGGLTAAIFLRRQGHKITLLEQSRFANEVGAAVHLAPNANGLLRRIGLLPEHHGAVQCQHLSQMQQDGKPIFSADINADAVRWQHSWQLAHRVSLHSELKRIAMSKEGKGTPAVLRTRSKVLDVDPAAGIVTLDSGETIQSDVVVGADGIHSKMRPRIPGAENIKTFGSGKSAFRFLISRERALAEPEARKFAERDGHLIVILGRDRRVVVYPTSNDTVLNFVCIHPTAESQSQSEAAENSSWQKRGSLGEMLEVFKDFEPALLKLMSMADEETLKDWELLDMEQLPSWTEGKLVLIGDAAHPFTPYQGQGAAQAIEDAASLAVMLPHGTCLDQIPARLKLYEKCRFERASTIQELSRIAGRDLGSGPPLDAQWVTNYSFGHDEWDFSSQVLRKWEWENKQGLLWRMPKSFGPMPGPCQDSRDGSKAKFTTASIKFKSSRTVLENLFPTEKLKFVAPDTIAYATFAVTQLDNLEWLGGRGYAYFSLYVHGVQYTKENGDAIIGTYLPVLFENLPDSVVSGREELGFPKLYCELNVQHNPQDLVMKAGWMSSQFGIMSFSGLKEAPATNGDAPPLRPAPAKDEGLFFHKHIPDTAMPGSKGRGPSDVEYTAFLPGVEDALMMKKKIERTSKATNAEIKFDALDWKALPTLHHVIDRLQEVPVFEVVEAKVVEGTGVSDISAVQRAEECWRVSSVPVVVPKVHIPSISRATVS